MIDHIEIVAIFIFREILEIYSKCSNAEEVSQAEINWIGKCQKDDQKLREIGERLNLISF